MRKRNGEEQGTHEVQPASQSADQVRDLVRTAEHDTISDLRADRIDRREDLKDQRHPA